MIHKKVYLLTRFNVGIFTHGIEYLISESFAEPSIVTPTEWMEIRTTMFERYCVPSIKNQTYSDLTWIIVMDERTPQCFITKLISLLQPLKIIWIYTAEHFSDECGINPYGIRDKIFMDSGCDNRSLIYTVNVDTDSMLEKTYIEQCVAIELSTTTALCIAPYSVDSVHMDNVTKTIYCVECGEASRIPSQVCLVEWNTRKLQTVRATRHRKLYRISTVLFLEKLHTLSIQSCCNILVRSNPAKIKPRHRSVLIPALDIINNRYDTKFIP